MCLTRLWDPFKKSTAWDDETTLRACHERLGLKLGEALESRPDRPLGKAAFDLIRRNEAIASRPHSLWGSILLKTQLILELIGPESADVFLFNDARVAGIFERGGYPMPA